MADPKQTPTSPPPATSPLLSSPVLPRHSPSVSSAASSSPVVRRTIICQDANLVGSVSVGEGCILHPKCNILAEGGPIVIGENNIVEELVTIVNKSSSVLRIGSNNLFEVGAHIECKQVGNNNVIETKGVLGKDSVVGDGCTVCAGARLPEAAQLANGTVLYSPSLSYNVPEAPDMHLTLHTRHLEILYKTLPNFHHLKTTGVSQ
eukprot:Phypoly_transcript_15704.p1 GENE.Phypoly_transcript_15704~~Phypoly_transcript_15704.p1  ORF type:complete len:233 (+),score=49.95 Phypoly_transcript_15704:87-701(+)